MQEIEELQQEHQEGKVTFGSVNDFWRT